MDIDLSIYLDLSEIPQIQGYWFHCLYQLQKSTPYCFIALPKPPNENWYWFVLAIKYTLIGFNWFVLTPKSMDTNFMASILFSQPPNLMTLILLFLLTCPNSPPTNAEILISLFLITCPKPPNQWVLFSLIPLYYPSLIQWYWFHCFHWFVQVPRFMHTIFIKLNSAGSILMQNYKKFRWQF